MDGRRDGQVDGWMAGRTDGWVEGLITSSQQTLGGDMRFHFYWVSEISPWYQTEQGMSYSLIFTVVGKNV